MRKPESQKPKTVVLTGASAGVGRAVARRFAEDGAKIGLIARDATRLERAATEIRDKGGQAIVCPLDVTDAEALNDAAERVEAEFGPIDIWINVAMATIFAPITQIEPAEFKRATEVTYLGFVYGTMAALKRMKPRDSGVIVQTGSSLAYRSIPLQAAYCGAKHAMIGFTDSLRCELIHDKSKVRIGVVNLPAVNTPQFDWGRNKMGKRPQPVPPIFQPEIPAEAIHYMAHHPRREIWLTWSTWKVMLGQRVAPGLLDHMLAKAAYSGQESDEDAEERPDNLFETVEGDYGAHGRFGDKARASSSQLWLAMHPAATATMIICCAILVVGLAILGVANL